MSFQPGDRVVCVDGGPSELGYMTPFVEGSHYTVERVSRDGFVCLNGVASGWLAHRFRKVEHMNNNYEWKVGDWAYLSEGDLAGSVLKVTGIYSGKTLYLNGMFYNKDGSCKLLKVLSPEEATALPGDAVIARMKVEDGRVVLGRRERRSWLGSPSNPTLGCTYVLVSMPEQNEELKRAQEKLEDAKALMAEAQAEIEKAKNQKAKT